uniref:DUF6527 family protein n=1 Tax=Francisella tularensis TaxID=263 RepID=UPI0034CE0C99
MKAERVSSEFVKSFPQELRPGILYVSAFFSTAAHRCACGCGREVVTPLSPAQWVLTFDGSVSLWPSIGSWTLPCNSHYVIERGKIRWSHAFTPDEIRRNQVKDSRALETERQG